MMRGLVAEVVIATVLFAAMSAVWFGGGVVKIVFAALMFGLTYGAIKVGRVLLAGDAE